MFEYYPIVLIFKFCFCCLSTLCYIVAFVLLWKIKLQRTFPGKLFISMCLAQMLIIVPLIISPFMIAPNDDPFKAETLDNGFCEFQGRFIMLGYMGSSLSSVIDMFIVLKAVKGVHFKKREQHRVLLSVPLLSMALTILCSIMPGTINMVPRGIQYYRDETQQTVTLYSFCFSGSNIINIIFIVVDILVLGGVIFLFCTIRGAISNLSKVYELQVDKMLYQVQYFALSQQSLWTINIIVKSLFLFAPDTDLSRGGSIAIQILSTLYYLEGVGMLFSMLYVYKLQLEGIIPRWIFKYIVCCSLVNHDSMIIFDSEIDDTYANIRLTN